MDFIDIALIAFAGLLAVPTTVFALQVFLAAGAGRSSFQQTGVRSRMAVLMPAHNEAAVIVDTLSFILPQLDANDRLLVVADNCSDDTAALAKACGADVIERHDASQRGKGYALDFGLRFLAEHNPPEVLIVIDADCQVSHQCIDTLARRAAVENRPVQALYLMQAPPTQSLAQAIAEFAWLVKNQVRPLGFMRMGLPCQLMGTGMAFPWDVLQRADLAHGNMVEDMKMGIDLALQGFAPVFCPETLVTSEFPTSEQVTSKQRTRWEHGHLATILAETPRLLRAAIRMRDSRLLVMALDLAVPPLSVLALNLFLLLSIALALAIHVGGGLSVGLALLLNGLFAVATVLAWQRFGRHILSGRQLLGIPAYIIRKIPLYLGFLFRRQQEWVKTDRH
ncbi:glycosyltransferase family 2 protein [Methylotuvimicrobium sp. KM1]|uniref:glycosyltransferase family 2 protein n=1 Tax=Methylotuvimicrobium sp. KM1 TaxID=3377707 RepID=UPI00384FD8FB